MALAVLPDPSVARITASPLPTWKCLMWSGPTTLTSRTPDWPVSLILILSPLASTKSPRRMVGASVQWSVEDTRKVPPGGPAGTQETSGATVSVTVTVWVAVAWLPERSAAVQVTTVAPTRNFGGASFVKAGDPPQSSVATGRPRSGEPQSR